MNEDSICQQNIISLEILDQDDPACMSTSTEEVGQSMVRIHPNPSLGIFYVEWLANEVANIEITVFNVN